VKRIFVAALLVGAAACNVGKAKAPTVQTAAVARRDIIIDAQATGVVEPIAIVEVKSKAGGAILKMPVETGMLVKPGDLLVQVDPRDAQNRYNQAQAALDAAQARLKVAEGNKKRQDDLFKARVITAQENETASVDYENAKSALVNAQASLDIAKQSLEDATVTAPTSGTVIDKTVSVGTVIASATNSVSGGTTLLKMADLTIVRVRALFNETDIGSVRGGQPATVTVDAYPTRPFQGIVEKIEPSAVVQQNVTMFPVLISLDNREGLLKPGMNGEVSVLIDERTGVLAVPNDAVKNVREAAAVATLLGLNPDSVQAEVRAQGGGGGGGFRGRGGDGPPGATTPGGTPTGRTGTSGGDLQLGSQDPQQGEGRRGGRGGFQMPQVSDEECKKIDDEMKKHAKEAKQIDALRAKMTAMRGQGGGNGGGGGGGNPEMRAINDSLRTIYTAIGIDSRTAGACRRRGEGGQSGGGRGQAGGGQTGGTTSRAQQGGGGGGAQLQPSPEFGALRQRPRSGLVFVAQGNTYHPKVVQLGQSNFDYTEVMSGLNEGDRVVLLASLAIQAQRQQQTDRARQNANPLGANPGGGGPGRGGPGGGGPGGGGGGGGAPRGGR
jgi:HlyD family secretion protein